MAESELTTIARPYARAAFSQSLEESSGLANWSRMLGLLSAATQQDVVSEALENPLLTRTEQANLVNEIMGEELNDTARNFVVVLAENGRLALLLTIFELYELLKAHHEKIMDVEISSAFEMSEADSDRIVDALKQKLQREISLSTSVDSSLIGGIIIRTEDTVIDNSVRGKLEKLSQTLG